MIFLLEKWGYFHTLIAALAGETPMDTPSVPFEAEALRAKRWAGAARVWDLERELDACKQIRDSFQRQIGLLDVSADQKIYHSLISRNTLNQQRIDIIEGEMLKRKERS